VGVFSQSLRNFTQRCAPRTNSSANVSIFDSGMIMMGYDTAGGPLTRLARVKLELHGTSGWFGAISFVYFALNFNVATSEKKGSTVPGTAGVV
jgi:hypothetical protein